MQRPILCFMLRDDLTHFILNFVIALKLSDVGPGKFKARMRGSLVV